MFDPNPGLYRELSTPYASVDEANKNLKAFWDDLAEIRKKHRIADLQVVIRVSALSEDGEEGVSIIHGGYGDQTKWESMLAYAFGMESAYRQERTAELLAKGMSQLKEKKDKRK